MSVTQAAFREALLDPDCPVPEGLTDPLGRPAGKRFNVYRNNVVASLSDALGTGFPVIAKLLGPENFRALAVAYSRSHPPRSPLMMHIGSDLPAFLDGFAPLAAYGYLSDVARLELALRESYHAADATPIAPETLAALSGEDLAQSRVGLAPALKLVESRWPIVQIWRFNMESGPQPSSVAEAAIVTRPGFDPQIDTLGPGGTALLKALMAGSPLGFAAEQASTVEHGFDPSATIGTLLAGQAITALTPYQDPT